MSNVYILPRRSNNASSAVAAANSRYQPKKPVQQLSSSPNSHQIVVVGGGAMATSNRRSLPALPGQKPGSRFVRASAQLGSSNQNRNNSSRLLLSQPHLSRMPMTAARRVYMAAPAIGQPQQQQHSHQIVQQPSNQPPQSRRANALKKSPQMFVADQSEEDEFDMDEVYQLLEESAGHRMQDELALPRRRERLTNLTAEEKMDRRKQKNRIAAQAARDRKKETTKKLEDSLKRALLEIGKLKSEVKALRAANGRHMADENQAFHQGPKHGEMIYGHAEQQQQQYHQAYPPHQNHQQHFVNMVDLKPATANDIHPCNHPSIANQGHNQHQQQMASKPMRQSQQRVDSLGSAESFNGPQQRERETAQWWQQQQQQIWPLAEEQEDEMARARRHNGEGKMGNKERKFRMACFIKILMAMSAAVVSNNNNKGEEEAKEDAPQEAWMKTSDCSKFSMNFLKNWRFPSMWTASATKSLRRELLRRMLTMDRAKLLRLSKSPQRQLVAHLLVRKEANRKARGRHRSLTPMMDISNSIQVNSIPLTMSNNNMVANLHMNMAMAISTTKSDQEEETAAIVPQMLSPPFPPRH